MGTSSRQARIHAMRLGNVKKTSRGLPRMSRASVAAAVAGILYSSAMVAYAADTPANQPADTPAEATENLQEVVVTANAQGGIRKLDASYSIVAVDSELIKQANPKSSADILKVSPGIWPESSGGQTGANIEVEGLPSGGDSPFFTNMIEGLPLYGTPSLSFMDSSSLFRLDDTIERVEVVQGGPGAVFGPAQMGATANYLLKTGTAEPHGSASVTYGTEGLYRFDGFYGFPIAPGWYGSVGGFYRDSSGVRDPEFPSDIGGQLTATLKHDLDGGSVMVWARGMSDKNQFITPIPLIQTGDTSFAAYPGFNPLKATYYSKSIQNVTIPAPGGGFENADLANGRGGNLFYFGIKYDQKFDNGWSASNNFLFDGGHLNTNALFSGNNPMPLSYLEYGCNVAQPTGYCGADGKPTNAYPLNSGAGYNPATGINATTTGGQAVAPDQSVITQGWWFIQKRLRNYVDEARVSKEVFDGNTATVGAYVTHYTDDENWSLGNQMLMLNRPNTQAVVLNYTQGGHIYNLTSPQGIINSNSNYNILAHGTGWNVAGYLSDTWKWNKFIFDASVRLEQVDIDQSTCNTTAQQLGSIYDLYDNAVPVCNGTDTELHYKKSMPTWTVGTNYEVLDNLSVYGRVNNGVHYDDFDNGIRGSNGVFAPLQTMKRYEAGFKFQNRFAYLDVSYWHLQFIGLPYQPTSQTGIPEGPISSYGSDSKGINFVGSVTPFQDTALRGLGVRFTGNWMQGQYTHYDGVLQYNNIDGGKSFASPTGQPLQRQPRFQVRVTPNYSMPLWDWGTLTTFMTYEHVGNRTEDIFGLQPLGSYYTLSGGVVVDYGEHYEMRVQGTNLTNQLGLTEGNARVGGVGTGIGDVLLARPLEGREVSITAAYKF
jgi:hypothetical protein